MKNIILSFILLIFLSCSKKEESVTLSIANKTLSYFDGYVVEPDDYPIQYKTAFDLLKGRNVIEYKLRNNSNKDILFLIEPYQLHISSNTFKAEERSSKYLFFIINNKENRSAGMQSGSYNLENWDYVKLLEYRQKDYYLKREIEIDNIFRKREALSNSFILKAGETKTFSVQLDLPIIEQPLIEDYLDFLAIMLTKEEYFFQIYYNMSQDEIEKLLKKEELEYFKNNNIEVFSGELLSNKVKIVPVK